MAERAELTALPRNEDMHAGDPMHFACAGCGRPIWVPENYVSKPDRCPDCGGAWSESESKVQFVYRHLDEFAEFLAMLQENGYSHVVPIDHHSYACIANYLAYTTAIIRGRWNDRGGYDDRWCYEDQRHAIAALLEWAENGFEGEPQGWHRHPKSGRRRPDGDWMKEYVNA